MTVRLALVPGEPAGIGPELCVRLAQRADLAAACVAFADGAVLLQAAQRLALPLQLRPTGAADCPAGQLRLVEHPVARGVTPGQADPANAASVIGALDAAAAACLAGDFDGLVTGPIHKATISAGGIAYTGTTERLAAQAGCDVAMMLARPDLRVVLVTTHLPLRAVAEAVTRARVERIIRITEAALRRDFGLTAPRIAVLGLNPHAGEEGLLGDEETEVIIPVLEQLRAEGVRLQGPLPADTAFLPDRLPGFDAVIAMYHDQGLPVLKSAGLDQAVNITLGLPYPRVAVDHGTALDIAGQGIASPGSLFAAMETCAMLARQRRSVA